MANNENGIKRNGKKKKQSTGVSKQLKRAGLFKGLLFFLAVVLTGALFIKTNQIVMQIRDASRSHLNLSVRYYSSLLLGDNPELAFEAVEEIRFPIILADEHNNPKFWKNIDIEGNISDSVTVKELKKIIAEMDRHGNEPVPIEVIEGEINYFHYGDPDLVSALRIYTLVSVIAVAIYIFLGYIGFRIIRKAEERSVWVGMARETAHQLGTPISSLMGWIEVLGESGGMATEKMKQDIKRLEQITVRFSKIGATETLKPHSVSQLIEDSVNYMLGRVGTSITISFEDNGSREVPLQPDLIGWVLENLIKNAAQAMGGEGNIKIICGMDKNDVYIDVIDTGQGIPIRDQENIFRPGYTTKRRGWGLGLSLARRIIEETHKGKIFVLESQAGVGTTIRVVLSS